MCEGHAYECEIMCMYVHNLVPLVHAMHYLVGLGTGASRCIALCVCWGMGGMFQSGHMDTGALWLWVSEELGGYLGKCEHRERCVCVHVCGEWVSMGA